MPDQSFADDALPAAQLLSWLDIDQRPRVVLDGDQRVVWRNAAAGRALNPQLPLFIEGDRLGFATGADRSTFQAAFQSASAKVQRLTLVPDTGDTRGVGLGVWAAGADAERRVFVKVTLLEPALGVVESGMAAHYKFTKAEVEVVEGLLRIESPAAIARNQGVSVHTVRSHVRGIYAKMGVTTQTQLIRLSLVFCGG